MVYRLDFPYAPDSQEAQVVCMNGGSSVCSNGVLSVTCGAGTYSGAGVQGLYPMMSCGRNDLTCEFTALFDAGACSNTLQVVGVGDGEHGVFVGYNGPNFGVRLLTGGQMQYYVLRIGSAAAAAGTLVMTLNGSSFSYPLTLGQSVAAILYQVAADPALTNANMQTRVSNNTVVINTALAMPTLTAPSVQDGGTGCSPGLSQPLTGAAPADLWAYPNSGSVIRGPADWNGIGVDPNAGISWSNTNAFKISIAPLGFGSIVISMLNPNTLGYTPIHTFNNSNCGQNLSNLTLGLAPSAYSVNFTGSRSLTVQTTGFIVGGLEGGHRIRPAFGYAAAVTTKLPQVSPTTLIVLQNMPLLGGTRNCRMMCMGKMTVSLSTQYSVQLSIFKNCRFGTALSGAQTDPNSCVLVDSSTSTSITGGTLVKAWVLTVSNPVWETCIDDVWAEPGGTLAFVLNLTQAPTVTSTVSPVTTGLALTWHQR